MPWSGWPRRHPDIPAGPAGDRDGAETPTPPQGTQSTPGIRTTFYQCGNVGKCEYIYSKGWSFSAHEHFTLAFTATDQSRPVSSHSAISAGQIGLRSLRSHWLSVVTAACLEPQPSISSVVFLRSALLTAATLCRTQEISTISVRIRALPRRAPRDAPFPGESRFRMLSISDNPSIRTSHLDI
jgi:hypothetical protein